MKRWHSRIAALVCTTSLTTMIAVASDSQESFESPETTWRLAESDCRPLRLARHERQFAGAHRGRGCEHLQLVAGQGTHIYLAHTVQPVRIIRELKPSVWVKSDRHGLQLMARVVLPRSLENGKPVTSFLFGDRYEATDAWHQLRIDDVLVKLHREVVALRTQKGSQLDEREAYIDMLVLNAYTGPGAINIWCDDLELAGFAAATSAGDIPDSWPNPETDDGPGAANLEPSDAVGARLQGNVLVAGGRPIFTRAVEHQGETMAFLQSLGFNTVKLATPPTPSQLTEAERCGVWLIAPLPILPTPLLADRPPTTATNPRIVAWHVGDHLTASDWADAASRMKEVAERESIHHRPFVANVVQGSSQWRHDSLVLLLEHPVLNTSFEMQDLVDWLQSAARQNRAQSPFWAAIPTEAAGELQRQVARLASSTATVVSLEPDQVRWMAFAAVAAGARGVWFRSRSRLDGQDTCGRLRAATLRQINRELELVAPWAAGGTAVGEQATNNPRVRVFALQTERARLLILLRRTADQQFVIAPIDPQQQLAFTLHSPPPTDQTYSISPAGVELLPSLRGGGLRLTLDSTEVVSLVLLTSDPLAVNYAGRTIAAIRNDVATARRDGLELLLNETESVERAVQARGAVNSRHNQLLTEVRSQLRRADDLRVSGDGRGLLRACDAAANALRRVRRGRWEQTVLGFTSPAASPVCAAYSTLPAHFALADQLAVATWGVDVLAGGEMENLEHLLSSGWKQLRAELAGVSADVQVSLEAPRGGRSALHLRAWATESGTAVLDGEPPLTITSAPISVEAGQLLRVRGWAKAPRRLDGSWDGLMIYDSHTGPVLAERIAETQGWREFTLYRVATATGEWQLIFALTGLGEAWLDDISVTALTSAAPRQAQLPDLEAPGPIRIGSGQR